MADLSRPIQVTVPKGIHGSPSRALLGLLGCLIASVLLACDRDQLANEGTVTVDTINGIVHVGNHGPGAWTRQSAWRAREVFRLGGSTEPVEQLFTSQLLGTAVGPHGNVYVLDHLAGTLHVFSPDGQQIRTIGRRGRGPSELAAATGFTWSDDGHIWVSDPGNRKYVVFDTVGQFVRTHERSTRVYPRRQYPLLYVEGLGVIDEALVEGDLVLLRTTLDGEIHDTLIVIERDGGASQALTEASYRRPGPEFLHVSRYYVSRMSWAVDPAGAIWTGSPEELRFVKRDWKGDTLMVVTADHRESQLTPEDEGLISEAIRRSNLDRSDINPIRPLFQALHVIEGGYLLVQLVDTPGEPSERFDVYDPSGRYLGELDLGFAPEPVGTLRNRGDLVVATMLGDLDIPYVVGVELIRPAGADEH